MLHRTYKTQCKTESVGLNISIYVQKLKSTERNLYSAKSRLYLLLRHSQIKQKNPPPLGFNVSLKWKKRKWHRPPNNILRDVTQIWPRRSLLSKCRTDSTVHARTSPHWRQDEHIALPCHDFWTVQQHFVSTSFAGLYQHRITSAQITDVNSLTCTHTLRLLLHRFNEGHWSHFTILWTSPAPTWKQTGRKMCEVTTEFYVGQQARHDFRCTA